MFFYYRIMQVLFNEILYYANEKFIFVTFTVKVLWSLLFQVGK